MIKRLEEIMEAVRGAADGRRRLALAAAEDADALRAVCDAAAVGIAEPILVGDAAKIRAVAAENLLDISNFEIVAAEGLADSADMACRLVADGRADFLMKGLLDTSIILKAVLNKEFGLRTDSLLSHVMVYESPFYHKLLLLTDGGMNIAPGLDDKKRIVDNAVLCARSLGIERIKVAALAAKEKVNEKMQATVDAAALQTMCQEGAFGGGVVVAGPLALDLAVSSEAAEIKGFRSEVAGNADVLLVHDIGMGNGIGKALTYLGNARSAGCIMGARVPVVLTSRADTADVKLYSIALAALVARQL